MTVLPKGHPLHLLTEYLGAVGGWRWPNTSDLYWERNLGIATAGAVIHYPGKRVSIPNNTVVETLHTELEISNRGVECYAKILFSHRAFGETTAPTIRIWEGHGYDELLLARQTTEEAAKLEAAFQLGWRPK